MAIGIDLFAGAGGMSLGATWAGITVAIAVDNNPHAIDTYRKNHPKAKVLATDIRYLTSDQLEVSEKPVILFGGPPCQGFSTSNQRTRNTTNPHNWLYRDYIRIASELSPDWIVFENVNGLLHTSKQVFYKDILLSLERLGYNTVSWVLNAKDFGVPQNRSRLFIVASLHGKLPASPTPTTLDPVSVKDAIFDLPILRNGSFHQRHPYRISPHSQYARRMREDRLDSANHLVTKSNSLVLKRYALIPRNGNWQSLPADLMHNYADRTKCHTGIYRRLSWNEPSVVIGNFRKNMLIHPTQTRGLSVREAARLQSFPDWYEFVGSIGFQQQQVGNAVPPLLSKAVFEAVLAC